MATNYWVSWHSPEKLGGWELHSPWWISGYVLGRENDDPIICAAIKAADEAAAKETVLAAYDNRPSEIDWRFVEERPATWSPYNDRFARADWMPDWPAAA